MAASLVTPRVMEGTGIKASRSSASRVRAPRWWLPLAALLVVAFSVLATGPSGRAATAYDAEEEQFLRLINDYRAENGLRSLTLSDTLTRASERHSRDMAEYDFFAHNTERSSYYPNGARPWNRMEAEGYDYNTAKGENLAVGYESAEEALRAWQDSPSHNAAMLDENYKAMGVARINVPGSVHGWYWTTDFGGRVDSSPRAAGESPEPAGTSGDPQAAPPEQPPSSPPSRPREDDPPDTGLLENGTLGARGVWAQQARDGADLVKGNGNARLGGYRDGRDDLRQRIRIGRDARLAYDLKVRGRDGDDRLLVRLTDGGGEQISVLRRHPGREATGRSRERVDLSRYAGRTVFLSFQVRTDAGRPTTFYLDNVDLKR